MSGPAVEDRPAEAAAVEDRVPQPAGGLQLIGAMSGSGYRRPPALVRRRDGQTIQLTPLLYLVLESIDGERDYDEIATRAGAASGRRLTATDVHTLVTERLRPLGLVCGPDGSEPDVRKANPLLALRFRWVVSDPERTRRLTAPFALLFNPLLVLAVVVAFVIVVKVVLFDQGLGLAAHEAFAAPGLLLAVFAVTLVSAGFHEFGHAAAARYGGATPGAMGTGLYLIWPAFYTDVTDSYRLGRGGRLRTDLGGLYFNAILAVATFGLWWLTGWAVLLLIIGAQLLQMIRQLPPLVRFDGYHVLADLTGVPDLFHQIKPTLAGLWPTRWRDARARALKPWARLVVTLWVLLVVPLMLLTALATVFSLPRIVASAAVSLSHQWSQMLNRFAAGDLLAGFAKLLAVIAVALPVFGIAFMLSRSVRQLVRSVLRTTRGRPGRQAVAAVAAAAVLTGLAFAWWPHGNYRPIRATDRGTLADLLPASFQHVDPAGLAVGRQSSAVTGWPADAGPVPTADHPALSLVLVPRGKAPDGSTAPTWVFPFNRPLPPGVGDNQTLAVNTANGTVVYDVAFAMVWADSDTVLNKNEAYAFAHCQNCQATAISFQVLLIVGQAHVIVPQNISAAVNYQCLACLAQALAVQLVVTLPDTPSQSELQQLETLWQQIQQFSQHLQGMSFTDIQNRLTGYEQQIMDVLRQDGSATSSSAASQSAGAPSGTAPNDSTTPDPTASPGSSDTGQPSVPDSSVAPSDAGSSTAPSDTVTGSTPTASPSPSGT
ncbi:MAG TPA: M50 family metallopeptidase [Jatrophihabitans sp.]|nr:M50 family metallopeptidase [Jatrophihabitans sp.]